MVDVLNTLPDDVKDFIEYKEWSIKNADGINMFVARKGRVLPTLCINAASDGDSPSTRSVAYLSEARMRSRVSMSVPSRSRRIASIRTSVIAIGSPDISYCRRYRGYNSSDS